MDVNTDGLGGASSEVVQQLDAVRRSGVTNMLDFNGVQQAANNRSFYQLVAWMESGGRRDLGVVLASLPEVSEPRAEHGHVQVVITFPSAQAAHDWMDWHDNTGEQDYYSTAQMTGATLLSFDYEHGLLTIEASAD